MRHALTAVLSTMVAAQEPPVLTTSPPAFSAQFGPAALGAAITDMAQLSMLHKPGSNPPEWYVTATVKTRTGRYFTGYCGSAVAIAPGNYFITNLSATELANLPAPTNDYFAFNPSSDRLVLVFDTGGSSAPAVYVRPNNNSGTPWLPFGSIPAPVPTGYRESQMGDTIASWNGTIGVYEYIYTAPLALRKVTMVLGPAAGQVTLSTPVTIATSFAQTHSASPMRQWTGPPTTWGSSRALLFSHNLSGADAWFRSSLDGNPAVTAPLLPVFDDHNWKACSGHIGGSTYWPYGINPFQDPLQLDVVCASSASVPRTGGVVTICAWAPPSPQPHAGLLIFGALLTPGINLAPLVTRGLLGIDPAMLVLSPPQLFDRFLGEISFTFATGPLPRGRIDTQVGCVNLVTGAAFLGNNAAVYVY